MTQLLGNYLQTSQQSLEDCTQQNEQNIVRIMQIRPCAMTATTVESERQRVERHYSKVVDLASDAFDNTPLWILQQFATSKIELAIASDSQHLHSLVQIAELTLNQRMDDGEDLIHDVIKGVVGHVDGQGPCFIDARNILNGVT